MSLKELQLPSIASLRAIAALKSPHLALVRPARIGLGFESAGASQKTLAEVEGTLGGPGRLSLPYSLRWLLDAMAGLSVLHRTLSFVHGEVQPEHIVLGEDGVGRLIPVVRAHWVRGEERAPERLYYLAPEKLLGDRVDVRSDVFSIGVLLWEALAGQRLLEANDVDDIIARLMGGGVPRPHTPELESWTAPLAAIAERAVAVDPGRRFATMAEMKEALQGACSRYLASPPGMAALFQNPELRKRNYVRDSIAPESQRLTLPPFEQPSSVPTKPPTTKPPPANGAHEAARAAATQRPALAGFSSLEPPDEETLKNSVPVPVVRPVKHIQTLLGVPPPFIDRESSPDAITEPFAKIPASTPVIITPLPLVPSAVPSRPPMTRSTTPLGPPAQLIVPAGNPASSVPPPSSVPMESRRAVSLAPLVAAQPSELPLLAPEPSFELVRPRKSRAGLWLLLGAAAAAAAFAARPWLAHQVASATGALPDAALSSVDAAANAPAAAAAPSLDASPSALPGSASPRVVGIASTPAGPGAAPRSRGRAGSREEHVVIHDSVDPEPAEPAAPAPVERQPEPSPPPAATPPPPPPPPTPAPKPKSAPLSEADRYGI